MEKQSRRWESEYIDILVPWLWLEWECRTKKACRFNVIWSFSAFTSSILGSKTILSKTKPPLHINAIYSTFIHPQRPQRGGKEFLLFTIKAKEPNGAAAANGEGEYHPAGRTFEMIFSWPPWKSNLSTGNTQHLESAPDSTTAFWA